MGAGAFGAAILLIIYVSTNFPETTLDTVIYVRGECRNPDTEIACNDDDPTASKVSTLLIPAVEAGVYYIVVDAFGPRGRRLPLIRPLASWLRAGALECARCPPD